MFINTFFRVCMVCEVGLEGLYVWFITVHTVDIVWKVRLVQQILLYSIQLDGVGAVDNRPSTDWLNKFYFII